MKYSGKIERPDGVGRAQNAATGEMITIYIKVENHRIADARFESTGCGASEVAAEAVCARAVGMHIDEAAEITHEHLEEQLRAAGLPETFCASLAADALHFAILKYALSS